MIAASDVQDLVARWWWNYDQGNFDVLRSLLTVDAHFSCRTDSGATDYVLKRLFLPSERTISPAPNSIVNP